MIRHPQWQSRGCPPLEAVLEDLQTGALGLLSEAAHPLPGYDYAYAARLLNSVLNGYPIGPIYLWRPAQPVALRTALYGIPVAPAADAVVVVGARRLATLYRLLIGKESRLGIDLSSQQVVESPTAQMPCSVMWNATDNWRFVRGLRGRGCLEAAEMAESVRCALRDYPVDLLELCPVDLRELRRMVVALRPNRALPAEWP